MPAKNYRWLIAKTTKQVVQKFIRSAKAIPKRAWQQWAIILGIGLGLCMLIMFVLTLWAMNLEWLQLWDEQMLLEIAKHFPMSFHQGITWQSPGNSIGMLPVVVTFIWLTSWFSRPLVAATAVVAYISQFAIVWVGWGMWNRDRPDLIANGVAAPGLHSFPSGHVTVITVVYGFLFYLWFRASRSWLERALVILFASVWIGLISMSRLVLGAHWPSDIIAGLAISLLWLISVIAALERSEALTKNFRS